MQLRGTQGHLRQVLYNRSHVVYLRQPDLPGLVTNLCFGQLTSPLCMLTISVIRRGSKLRWALNKNAYTKNMVKILLNKKLWANLFNLECREQNNNKQTKYFTTTGIIEHIFQQNDSKDEQWVPGTVYGIVGDPWILYHQCLCSGCLLHFLLTHTGRG